MPREVLGTSRGLSFLPNLPQNKRLVTFSPGFLSTTKRTRNTPENAHFSQVLGPLFSRPRTRALGLKSAIIPWKYASYADFALEKSEKSWTLVFTFGLFSMSDVHLTALTEDFARRKTYPGQMFIRQWKTAMSQGKDWNKKFEKMLITLGKPKRSGILYSKVRWIST